MQMGTEAFLKSWPQPHGACTQATKLGGYKRIKNYFNAKAANNDHLEAETRL